MAWSKAVEAIANSVSEIAKTVAAFGPNDEGKVVRAAKSAGNKAKNMVKKAYPKCETEKEYKKKIEPLNLEGVDSRAQYNYLRATIINDAYTEAYNGVMQMYHERMVMESGGVVAMDAQHSFDEEVNSSLEAEKNKNMLSGSSGCMGAAFALVGSSLALGGLILSLIF